MTIMTKILAGSLGLAAFAAAAPAAAQYQYGYPYGNTYGYQYGNTYGYPYGYQPYRASITQIAANQCTAAVQARLNNRRSVAEVIGSLVGANTAGRVLSVTSVNPNRNRIRVRGLASSGRYAYNPYGYGYYGALGYNYANSADISFRCDVDYRGRVRDIDLDRRR